MSKPRFYVTTPIYYANDEPHIGHTYTTVVADAVARYRRAMGCDVRFLTGTDEHGQKMERAAKAHGLHPQALADRVVARYRDLWEKLSISHDDFIRTTEPRHHRGVERLIRRMIAAGDVYLGAYEGMYCAGCEAFYPESQIVNGRCPEQGHPVERVSEPSYFFRLSKFQQPLLDLYARQPDFVRPATRANEVRAFVESGLRDLSISRTSLRWGIPFPDAPGHVVYVWVDALTNYMSALGYGSEGDAPALRYWPAQVHLVGKDIVRFHAVYWPAFLMSAGEPLPQTVFAHGWWLRDDAKMSKSLGNVVKPEPLLRDFGPDALRYFLLRELTFGLDGTYSDEQMLDRYNGDLANDLGNVTSRVLALLVSGCGGVLPAAGGSPAESELRPAAEAAFEGWRTAFDAYDFSAGLAAVWGLLAEINRYLVRHAPWELRGAEQAAVLRGAAEALLQVACMAEPVLPVACREIAARLGTEIPAERASFRFGLLPEGVPVRKAGPLFPRVDRAAYFKEEAKVSEISQTDEKKDDAGLLTIEDFLRVDLRVAKVTAAERIPGADKLLKLQLDLGTEQRQIVAGIAKAYAPEDLVGKSIVVVANLKPAKLRGVESQGMLLAADAGGRPIVATFEESVPPGTRVR